MYWEIRYLYFPPKSKPGGPVSAFPSLMRSDGKALNFYERNIILDSNGTRYPQMLFTLPYPAKVDSVLELPRSDFRVRVVAKDVPVQLYDSTSSYRCYLYEVSDKHGEKSIISVIPGSAIFKVELEDLTYYTVEWKVE